MDKRLYMRENVDLEGVFYFEYNGEQVEFLGKIGNISEGGIAVTISNEEYKDIVAMIAVGTKLDFVSYDEYKLFGQDISTVISNQIMVIRKESADGDTVIGCQVIALSREFEKYVLDLKTSRYMESYHI